MSELFSRYNDTALVKCQDCGWEGMVKDCKHKPIHFGDCCPECDSDQLWPVEKEGV